ncbi:MAG: hypothetical protein JST84_04330 [Acidobacteria bacterium]|nr:hypothetical protein [Acidobacteriota bacterium]
MNNIKYGGMDVHKAITVIVVLNSLGQVESHTEVETKAQTLCDFFRGLRGTVEVTVEEGVKPLGWPNYSGLLSPRWSFMNHAITNLFARAINTMMKTPRNLRAYYA